MNADRVRVDDLDPIERCEECGATKFALALRQAAMYPPKEYAGKDPAAISRNPIGTGPYKFVRWSKDEEIVMEAFPGYWAGAAKIGRASCRERV